MCLEQMRPKTGFIVEMTAAIAFQRVTFNGTSLLGHCIQGKFKGSSARALAKMFPKDHNISHVNSSCWAYSLEM